MLDEAIYGSDDFRMYAYKIKRCTRTRTRLDRLPLRPQREKAQRRDPRKVPYCAIACPAFRNGKCPKATRDFAHGVFEYWLHPLGTGHVHAMREREHASSALIAESSGSPSTWRTGDQYVLKSLEILKSLRVEIDEEERRVAALGLSFGFDLPNIEWISELCSKFQV
ncbi:uncharacterized protein LOC116146216 [Pistacia vera]|uniref:uncharacterized protein LOC116146216 n=1 Tax=Pistacia vera TaxID=55513 RepID=UPI001262EA14|nr:uncharacterized protein LOC116146216 [Pistacia vera]